MNNKPAIIRRILNKRGDQLEIFSIIFLRLIDETDQASNLIPGTEAINIQDGNEIKPLAVSKFNPNLESAIELRRY
jgi:hypothetical protein